MVLAVSDGGEGTEGKSRSNHESLDMEQERMWCELAFCFPVYFNFAQNYYLALSYSEWVLPPLLLLLGNAFQDAFRRVFK